MAEADSRGRLFEKLDLDVDGLVTRSEAVEARGQWFVRADGDGDGAISREEWRVAAERRERKSHGGATN